jgi:hypothetical protein
MRFRLERLHELVAEVDEDVLLADDGGAVLEPKRRDRVGAHDLSEGGPRLALDRHGAVDVVEPKLGQPLADAPRSGAPLGLEQLEHPLHHRPPPTTSRSESTCSARLPQTSSQSVKTPWSAIE